MRFIYYILLFVCPLLWACEESAPVEKPAQVRSIECLTSGVSLDSNQSAEIHFRVNDARASFNFAVASVGCQVQLRLHDNILQQPSEFKLTRVQKGVCEGEYVATITDCGFDNIYSNKTHIVIKLESGALIRSNDFMVTSANFVGGITDIRIERSRNSTLRDNIVFKYSSSTQKHEAHIKEYVANRTFIPTITTSGIDRITIDGKEYHDGDAVEFKRDVILTAWQGDKSMDYTLHLGCFTNIPVVHIETPGRQEVWSKDTWVEGSTLRLDGMGIFDDIEDTEMSIRGRGNSTWGYEKKPYNIKFSEKQKVMGMPKHKRWCLLANYMDRTLLRNRVAYYLAEQTSLAWTPKCEFVELFLNGRHLGQYLLTEQVRVDNDRIAITEMTPDDNTGDAITGGYLLELDFHFDHTWQWWSSRDTPFSVKFPDDDDLTPQQFEWIQNHIYEVEQALGSDDFADEEIGYSKYIDAQSFIDYWLIYEICINHELANPGSVFLSKDRGGKIVAGPVWDFDWGTFSWNASPQAQYGLFMTHAWWYDRLFDDPAFTELARERWQILKPRFMTVFDFIEQERNYIYKSWQRNFEMWTISTSINGDEYLSFGEAVDRLVDITRRRMEIIDRELQ